MVAEAANLRAQNHLWVSAGSGGTALTNVAPASVGALRLLLLRRSGADAWCAARSRPLKYRSGEQASAGTDRIVPCVCQGVPFGRAQRVGQQAGEFLVRGAERHDWPRREWGRCMIAPLFDNACDAVELPCRHLRRARTSDLRRLRVSGFLLGASSALCSWPRKPWRLACGLWRPLLRPDAPQSPRVGMPPKCAAPREVAPAPWPLPATRRSKASSSF